MICCYRMNSMLKPLLWIMCIAAIMLCFVFVVPVHHMTFRISQSNQVGVKTTTRNLNSNTKTLSGNPSYYLQSDRFDLIVKMVYAYFQIHKKRVPKVVLNAYTEHIRVWNNFKEYCNNLKKSWFDGNVPCRDKNSKTDFILAFHKTIEIMKMEGFNSSMSRIPLDKSGFLLNGAHRVAAAVILSKNATFEHHNYEQRFHWGYNFFKKRGMSETAIDMVMLEWMKIQLKLTYLNTSIVVVSIFSNNVSKDETMRKIVKEQCSKDNGIAYEKRITFTRIGVEQLLTHMYGQQTWLGTKIQQMLSKFNSTYHAVFLFIYAKSNSDLVQCKNEIRKLYNDKIFKSTVHIPDSPEENLILTEMILNPSAIQFMNYAKNAMDCKLIAEEISSRSSIAPIKTLPGIYVGRDDVMIDSGTVLGMFGLRKRTDVDLLFLQKIDKGLLGNRHGISIQAHAFINNSISKDRAWGEDHFSANGTNDPWDLFYDSNNFGYCYGIKFVSLKQLIRYKTKRNEPKKDKFDIDLINKFLKSIQ